MENPRHTEPHAPLKTNRSYPMSELQHTLVWLIGNRRGPIGEPPPSPRGLWRAGCAGRSAMEMDRPTQPRLGERSESIPHLGVRKRVVG